MEKNVNMVGILKGEKVYDYEFTDIVKMFEEQCLKTPQNVAIKQGIREVTYEELYKKINNMSIAISCIPQKTNRVCILLENSIEAIISIFAIFKSELVYIPLSFENGIQRNKEILLDCKPDILLVSDKSFQRMKEEWGYEIINSQICVIRVEELLKENQAIIDSAEMSKRLSCDTAYIIYTSGSTGTPKGVVVTHKNLMNYLLWAKEQYIYSTEILSFALFTLLSVDLTITSLFLPLITGNRIVIYESVNSAYALKKIVNDNVANIIKLTPSHLQILEKLVVPEMSSIKMLIVGGEILSAVAVKRVLEAFSTNIVVYNEYGPTETTVGCMIYKFNPEKDINGSVPIGQPIRNVDVYILDENMKPVTTGEIGEIYISGHSVSKGYLNNGGMTQDRFISDILGNDSKMYKTGDLAYVKEDRDVVFVGRSDRQVKIRGHRIELDEVEIYMKNIEGVKDVVVLFEDNIEKNGILKAYIICETDRVLEMIKEKVEENLPKYMTPHKYIRVLELPYTLQGKIDRKKLINI